MKKELSYEEYNKLYNKYHITAKSRKNTIETKFLKACMELPEIDSDLMNSHIMDCFFENGDRVENICIKLLVEKAKYSFWFKNILQNYFNESYILKRYEEIKEAA